MIRRTLVTKVSTYDLFLADATNLSTLCDWFDYIITTRKVLHNKEHNFDYVVEEIEWRQELIDDTYTLKVIVNILEDYREDLQLLEDYRDMCLIELLPTKRGENRGEKKYEPLLI